MFRGFGGGQRGVKKKFERLWGKETVRKTETNRGERKRGRECLRVTSGVTSPLCPMGPIRKLEGCDPGRSRVQSA